MKLLITPPTFRDPENRRARELAEAFADEIVYNELGVPLKGEEIVERADGVDGYIAGVDYIGADVIARMPASLRVISRHGAGVDRVDLAACRERGIVVTNTPGANATAVCELAFALMLAAARQVPQLHQAVERGEWPHMRGMELAGKTLGVVGMGAIGKRLALRALAFEMRVCAFDPCFDEDFAAAHGICRMELDELIGSADVVSLHVPLTDGTRHLIHAGRIAEMKPGAILINTARGGLVDEQAAADALKAHRLRGVGLDAFEQEPLAYSPLMGLPGVVLTPHTGAQTAEAVENMGLMSVQNAIAVLRGEPCPYILK